MEALDKEYGDPDRLSSAYIKQLREWPSIRSGDGSAHRKMLRFLTKCQISKRNSQLQILDSADMIRLIISRFGQGAQDTWNKQALSVRQKKGRKADLSDVIEFVQRQTDLVANPEYSRTAYGDSRERPVKIFATSVESPPESPVKCLF